MIGSVLWEKDRVRCPDQIFQFLDNSGTVLSEIHEGDCATCLATDLCNHPCCHNWFLETSSATPNFGRIIFSYIYVCNRTISLKSDSFCFHDYSIHVKNRKKNLIFISIDRKETENPLKGSTIAFDGHPGSSSNSSNNAKGMYLF